jgi:hypothetical protein
MLGALAPEKPMKKTTRWSSGESKAISCWFCGEPPEIIRVGAHWWNCEHDLCDGEPGVSICNSPSRAQAVHHWNLWNKRMATEFPAAIQLELW